MLKYLYQKTLGAFFSMMYDRLIKPIFTVDDSPHSIALGVALGLWISLTPTVGIQMMMAVILCTIFRANIIIAVALCWVSNPVTFIPMYYGYYKFGLLVLNQEGIAQKDFSRLIQNPYVTVQYSNETMDNAARSSTELIAILKEKNIKLAYSGEDKIVLSKIRELGQQLKIDLPDAMFVSVTGDQVEVLKYVEKQPETFGIVDAITWNRYLEDIRQRTSSDPPTPAIVSSTKTHLIPASEDIKREYNFFQSLILILILSLQEFAVPMWVGSLIIATVLSIPMYPITKRAVTKFRTARHKENPEDTKSE